MIDLSQEEILAIYLSLKIAFTASLVSLPLAIFLGYLFARKEFLFKKFFISLLNLPLVLPPVVTGYILLIVFGINGFVGKFFFYGFFPENKGIIAKDMSVLSNLDTSIIFFISSKKFKRIIPFLKKYFSNRQIVICKEMTKYYEQYIRAEINNIGETNFELKGELTLVLSEKKIKENSSHFLSESDKYMINKMINKFTTKEISEIISKNTKISKKEVYNYCLKIKNKK